MFAHYFHDNLAGFAATFTRQLPAHDGPAVAGHVLSEPQTLAGLLDRYATAQGYQNHRAAASQWSKFFFSHLIIPTLVSQLGGNQRLDMRPDHWQCLFSADGVPVAFQFREPPSVAGDAADFGSLVDDAMRPIVTALYADCRLSSRVFWSNASMYFIWALGELETQAQLPAERLARSRDLLDRSQRADGGLNPFYHAHKALSPGALDGNQEPAQHCRRLCCLRDLDPMWGLCPDCPRAVHYPDPRARAG